MTLADERRRLFDMLESDQGYGFVSDADDKCATAEELAQYAEDVAYHMQRAANKARNFARGVRHQYDIA